MTFTIGKYGVVATIDGLSFLVDKIVSHVSDGDTKSVEIVGCGRIRSWRTYIPGCGRVSVVETMPVKKTITFQNKDPQ